MKAADDGKRKEAIDVLVFLTGRPASYFENFSNERLEELYDEYNPAE